MQKVRPSRLQARTQPAEEGEQREDGRDAHHPDLAADDVEPPVEAVGQDAGEEAEQEHRQRAGRRQQRHEDRLRVRLVISHAAPVVAIQPPVLDSTLAVHSARKARLANGAKADAAGGAAGAVLTRAFS